MNIPEHAHPRLVIIGAGFGGLNLVKALSRAPYQIVLIDKNNYHTFQPLLYQVASAGLEPDSIAHGIRSVFEPRENFFFRMANVHSIDTRAQQVRSDIGSISYDYLVVATGSVNNFFGNRQFEQLSLPMKSIPEALDLRSAIIQNFEAALLTDQPERIKSLLSYVIVGGGPTGVELAGALAELKNHILERDYPALSRGQMHIYLIEAAPRLLEGLSAQSSEKARRYLERNGVEIWFNHLLEDYDGETAKIGERKIKSDNLIWAAGVKGNIPKGLPPEAQSHSRLIVNAFNQIKGFENVFAIGDAAALLSRETPKGHPMVAQVAIQQARRLAQNLEAKRKGHPMRAFTYRDRGTMATLGRNHAVADLKGAGLKLRFSGFIGWIMWLGIHLVWLVGFRNKVIALSNWVIQYFQYGHNVDLIIRPFKRNSSPPSRNPKRQDKA